jgi:hypothetical protein
MEQRMSDDDYDFDDDGEMAVPTIRGNANLDPQDYARGPSGRGSSLLDDDLEEDTPSTPGRNPGAASAPDIDGDDDWDIQTPKDGPGMAATTYGNHPWGPGSAVGYRPQSMQRTDMALRDTHLRGMGDVENEIKPKPMERDSMYDEPEVLEVDDNVEVPPARWHGNRNQRPSNAGIPSDIIYDRESYEYDDSSQDTIGSGIFDMEEGVTWRPRDGMFAHQYALPAYIGDEDELGVQQSEMFDTTANEWRVVQPSAGGVPLKTRVAEYKPGYSPFVKRPVPEMRPEVTGPRSHIEAFGRATAALVVAEAKAQPPAKRAEFLARAVESLGPGMAARAGATAKKLVEGGQSPATAVEDSVAHAVMAAAVNDLKSANRVRGKLANLDRLAGCVRQTKAQMQQQAVKHIAPLTRDTEKLKNDLGALYASPAARGMGQVTEGGVTAPAAPAATFFTPRNLIIGAVVGIGGYYAWQNRKKIVRNAKKIARKAGIR